MEEKSMWRQKSDRASNSACPCTGHKKCMRATACPAALPNSLRLQ